MRRSDRILVVGNPAFLPWLTNEIGNEYIARASSIAGATRHGEKYDKIILGRETEFVNDHITEAGKMNAQLIYFPQDEGAAWQFKQSFEFYYPDSRIWELDSTFGRVIIAEPNGASWRFYNV